MFHYDKDPPSHPFTSLSCSISCPSGGGRPHGAAGDIWAVSPPRRTPLTSVCPWTLRPVPAAPCSLLNVGVSAALPRPRVKKRRVLKENYGKNTPRFDVWCNNICFLFVYSYTCWCRALILLLMQEKTNTKKNSEGEGSTQNLEDPSTTSGGRSLSQLLGLRGSAPRQAVSTSQRWHT